MARTELKDGLCGRCRATTLFRLIKDKKIDPKIFKIISRENKNGTT